MNNTERSAFKKGKEKRSRPQKKFYVHRYKKEGMWVEFEMLYVVFYYSNVLNSLSTNFLSSPKTKLQVKPSQLPPSAFYRLAARFRISRFLFYI